MNAKFRPVFLNTADINNLPIQNGQLIINKDNGHLSIDANNTRIQIGEAILVTFNDLLNLITNNELTPDTKYFLIDYKFTNPRHLAAVSPVEALVVVDGYSRQSEGLLLHTNSRSTLLPEAISYEHPTDEIRYTVDLSKVGVLNDYRGEITYRKDTTTSTEYEFDFRNAYELVVDKFNYGVATDYFPKLTSTGFQFRTTGDFETQMVANLSRFPNYKSANINSNPTVDEWDTTLTKFNNEFLWYHDPVARPDLVPRVIKSVSNPANIVDSKLSVDYKILPIVGNNIELHQVTLSSTVLKSESAQRYNNCQLSRVYAIDSELENSTVVNSRDNADHRRMTLLYKSKVLNSELILDSNSKRLPTGANFILSYLMFDEIYNSKLHINSSVLFQSYVANTVGAVIAGSIASFRLRNFEVIHINDSNYIVTPKYIGGQHGRCTRIDVKSSTVISQSKIATPTRLESTTLFLNQVLASDNYGQFEIDGQFLNDVLSSERSSIAFRLADILAEIPTVSTKKSDVLVKVDATITDTATTLETVECIYKDKFGQSKSLIQTL